MQRLPSTITNLLRLVLPSQHFYPVLQDFPQPGLIVQRFLYHYGRLYYLIADILVKAASERELASASLLEGTIQQYDSFEEVVGRMIILASNAGQYNVVSQLANYLDDSSGDDSEEERFIAGFVKKHHEKAD